MPRKKNELALKDADGQDIPVPKLNQGALGRYNTHSASLANLKPLSVEERRDPVAVDSRCRDYFALCADEDIKPSYAGLAVAIGVCRRTLDRVRSQNQWGVQISEIIQRYADIIDVQLTNLAMDGKVHYMYAEFIQKNTSGYTDKTELTVEKGDSLLTKDDLLAKAAALDDIPDQQNAQNEPIKADFRDADNAEHAEQN